MSSASEKLAEEFIVIPYPFVGEHRDAIEAEYTALLNGGLKPTEVADLILQSRWRICSGDCQFLRKCSQIKNTKNQNEYICN